MLRLRRDRTRPAYCSGCWREAPALHDTEWRTVRDLPMFEHAVELQIPRVRVACPHCGPKLELLGWLDPYARVTKRLAESVSRLCAVMSNRHVADDFGLNWKTVKNIDKRSLERRLGPVDLKGVTVIGMDEFAIQRGHRYATVVIEPARKRVLWVGRERSREGGSSPSCQGQRQARSLPWNTSRCPWSSMSRTSETSPYKRSSSASAMRAMDMPLSPPAGGRTACPQARPP